jgi:hypothetical protein
LRRFLFNSFIADLSVASASALLGSLTPADHASRAMPVWNET